MKFSRLFPSYFDVDCEECGATIEEGDNRCFVDDDTMCEDCASEKIQEKIAEGKGGILYD